MISMTLQKNIMQKLFKQKTLKKSLSRINSIVKKKKLIYSNGSISAHRKCLEYKLFLIFHSFEPLKKKLRVKLIETLNEVTYSF